MMTTDTPVTPDPFAHILFGHSDWLANHPDNLIEHREHWNSGFSFECGPGWAGLLERLFDDLGQIARPTGDLITIRQLKEKFGTLRVYWRGAVDHNVESLIDDAILLAAFRSEITCQTCGDSGQMRRSGFGWYHVACDIHTQRGDQIVARKVIRQISAQFKAGIYSETIYDPILDMMLKRVLSRAEYDVLTEPVSREQGEE